MVWEQIAATFPPKLSTQPITTCDCNECQEIRANLGHLRWVDILPPVAEKTFGTLPLLTDEAFQSLLPAFLFRALEDISPENKFLAKGHRVGAEAADWGDWRGEFRAVLDTGVDGIFVDHPDLGVAARDSRN